MVTGEVRGDDGDGQRHDNDPAQRAQHPEQPPHRADWNYVTVAHSGHGHNGVPHGVGDGGEGELVGQHLRQEDGGTEDGCQGQHADGQQHQHLQARPRRQQQDL